MAMVEVKVPDIGDFENVEVIELLVKAGDTVKVEQSLVTVESDKASMEIPCSHAGVVKELKVKLGDKVGEGSLLLLLEAEAGAPAAVPAAAEAAAPVAAPAGAPAATAAAPAAAAGAAAGAAVDVRRCHVAGEAGEGGLHAHRQQVQVEGDDGRATAHRSVRRGLVGPRQHGGIDLFVRQRGRSQGGQRQQRDGGQGGSEVHGQLLFHRHRADGRCTAAKRP